MSEGLESVFTAAGCSARLCVQSADASQEVALGADDPVVAASVFKVLVAVTAESAFVTGRLDPHRRVRLLSKDRTPGPTGFSLFRDDVEVSAQDLVSAMLTISDNVATDALLDLLGIDACNQTATDLGLADTVIVSNLADMIRSIAQEAGFADWRAFTDWQSSAVSAEERHDVERRIRRSSALTPATATRTTARDMCTLLRLIDCGQAGPPSACTRVLGHMAHQLTRNRLAADFAPPTTVAAKSGGLLGIIRNEVGVIRRPIGSTFYAAVFTKAEPNATEAGVNAAIALSAATAVDGLTRRRQA